MSEGVRIRPTPILRPACKTCRHGDYHQFRINPDAWRVTCWMLERNFPPEFYCGYWQKKPRKKEGS
jgi:hypothetical protein